MNEGRVCSIGTVEDARASPKVQEVYIGTGNRVVAAAARDRARVSACWRQPMSTPSYGTATSHDVNFTLHRNEIIALLGRNGAGKSTLSKR